MAAEQTDANECDIMNVHPQIADDSVESINTALDSLGVAFGGVARWAMVQSVTVGANAAFSATHKLQRRPDGYICFPEAACQFYWTRDDQQATSDKVIVIHSTVASVRVLVWVFSLFE